MNLLSFRLVMSLLGSSSFPIVPQVLMLAVFGLLVAGGIGITAEDVVGGIAGTTGKTTLADAVNELRNTNLASLVVWSYWWPVIIAASIVLGRVWCMVCPIELVSFLFGRFGLRLQAPRMLRSGWGITIFYALILIIGIHGLAIHRVPHRMAVYLLVLLGTAIVASLIFQKRAFCSYVCPVGHLLGLYALISPLEWRANDEGVCKACKTKDCVIRQNHYRVSGRSCTSNLYPATIKNNKDCLLCTQCLKACPYDNLRLSTRRPFADFFRAVELSPAQTAFVLMVGGFVVYEILSEWKPSKAILTWIPLQLVNAIGATGATADSVSALVMFVLFPAIVSLALVASVKTLSTTPTGQTVRTFAVLLIPTMAAAHLVKTILKMVSRIPYWSHGLSDPTGIRTARKILGAEVVLDQSVPNLLHGTVTFAMVALLVLALVATLVIFAKSPSVKKLDLPAKVPVLVGTVAYWSIFGLTVLKWRF